MLVGTLVGVPEVGARVEGENDGWKLGETVGVLEVGEELGETLGSGDGM